MQLICVVYANFTVRTGKPYTHTARIIQVDYQILACDDKPPLKGVLSESPDPSVCSMTWWSKVKVTSPSKSEIHPFLKAIFFAIYNGS